MEKVTAEHTTEYNDIAVTFTDPGSFTAMRNLLAHFKDLNKAFFLVMLVRESGGDGEDEIAIPDSYWYEYHMSPYDVRKYRSSLEEERLIGAKRKWSEIHGANVYHYTLDNERIDAIFGGSTQCHK